MSKAAELLQRLEEVCPRDTAADTGVGYPQGQDAGKIEGNYPPNPDMKPGRMMGQPREVNYRK